MTWTNPRPRWISSASLIAGEGMVGGEFSWSVQLSTEECKIYRSVVAIFEKCELICCIGALCSRVIGFSSISLGDL